MIKVVFCLTGDHFSHNFLVSWTDLVESLPDLQVTPSYSYTTGSNIFALRNNALGGDKHSGIRQVPFQGTLEYDYIMWIDSDQVFEHQDFATLLTTTEKIDSISILAGYYLDKEGKELSAGTIFPDSRFKYQAEDGHYTPKDFKNRKKPVEVDFAGMGFMLVRRGVYEQIDYPWFAQLRYQQPGILEDTSEDIGFCIRAKAAGFTTYVHPLVKIGHEKSIILTL